MSNKGPAAANFYLPSSYFALPNSREFQILDESGKPDRALLDQAWAGLQRWSTGDVRQAQAARNQAEENAALDRLAKLYKANGWDAPSIKQAKESRRAEIQHRTMARRLIHTAKEKARSTRSKLAAWIEGLD